MGLGFLKLKNKKNSPLKEAAYLLAMKKKTTTQI